MKTRAVVLGLACLACAPVALAEGLQKLPYSNVLVSYATYDFDDSDLGADGYGIGASYEVGGNFFVGGGYGVAETDDFPGSNISVQVTQLRLGLGYHHSIGTNVDLVPTLALIDSTAELKGIQGFPDDDESGWSAGLGVRSLVTPHAELGAGVHRTEVDGYETTFGFDGTWHPTESVGLGAGYTIGDDSKVLSFWASLLF